MGVLIRKATKDDCVQMMELVRELAFYENAPEQVTVTLTEFEDAGFGNCPVWGAFVAEWEGSIVGMSLYYERYSTWKGRRLYLEDLIVTEKMRGNAIGKQLFDATLAFAKESNYHGMVWQVLDWNEPAINFYKKYPVTFDAEWMNGAIDF